MRLTGLKKNLADSKSREDRMKMIDREEKKLSITKQAELLSINRTSLYYKPVPANDEEYLIKRIIDEIYTAHPEYGYRRMTNILNREYHIRINRKRTRRYMREMGIHGFCPGPNLSKRLHGKYLYPLDQLCESLITSNFEENSNAWKFAYAQFFEKLEMTVEELTKCFLLEFGDNKNLSFGRCKTMKSFNELYDGLHGYNMTQY
jgi:hypothetical protein